MKIKGGLKMKSKLSVLLVVTFVIVGLSSLQMLAAKASLPIAVPAATPFIGTWQTTWTTTDKRTVTAPVTIKAETGNATSLDGTVEVSGPNGTMYGSLSADGKTWTGNWWNPDGVHGTFTFTLKDNKNFTGSYTQAGANDSFDWHGNK